LLDPIPVAVPIRSGHEASAVAFEEFEYSFCETICERVPAPTGASRLASRNSLNQGFIAKVNLARIAQLVVAVG